MRAVLRTALTVIFLLVVYFAVPLREKSVTLTIVLILVAGLIALGWTVVWQVRAVVRSKFPRLRAAEALSTFLVLYLVVFGLAYVLMDESTVGAFSQHLTRLSGLYFALTVFTTVGFGDITPRTDPARVLVMVQMLGNLIFLGIVVRILLGAMQMGLDRRTNGTDEAHDG